MDFPPVLRHIIYGYLGPETCYIIGAPSTSTRESAVKYAVVTGWLPALAKRLRPQRTDELCRLAIIAGHVSVLEWLRPKWYRTPNYLALAVSLGNIHMIMWLVKHRKITLQNVELLAQSYNSEAVIKWLDKRHTLRYWW